LPKKRPFGEDADPLVFSTGHETWIGVFDGVGGAGATTYQTVEGVRTGAYLASRLAASTVRSWIEQEGNRIPQGDRASSLNAALSSAFVSAFHKVGNGGSRIRSKLLKTLPTTAAILGVTRDSRGYLQCNALWAGDSRVFILTASAGLIQISADHLKEKLDPQQNLMVDSALSNYISADRPFYIEETLVSVPDPMLAIVASDGCYGYVVSPVIFEYLILSTLIKARSIGQWKDNLAKEVGSVTADDASMVILPFGWPSFRKMKKALSPRKSAVGLYASQIQSAQEAVNDARPAANAAEESYTLIRDAIWNEYKKQYQPALTTTRSQ
jgi:serine/threonine protein phosphatase PrpC